MILDVTHLTIKAHTSTNHRSVDTHAQALVTHGLVVDTHISVVVAVTILKKNQTVSEFQTKKMEAV